MKCQNHPAANAIEQCTTCDAALCGTCCTFTDKGVFCEKCFAAVESKRKLEAEIHRRAQPNSRVIYEDPEARESVRRTERDKDKWVVWGVIIAFVAVGAVQLYRYGNPSGVGLSTEEEARNRQLISSVQCAAVFQRIGQLLAQDREPPDDLLCELQQTPNVITRNGNEVRVAHPNPQLYGFAEIWVSSRNPNPQMVRLAN